LEYRPGNLFSKPINQETWKLLADELTVMEALDLINTYGWDSPDPSVLEKAQTVDIYIRVRVPGVQELLLVPSEGPAIEFSAFSGTDNFETVAWGGVSADDIKDKILEGMQAAIDGLCSMRARPNEIRAKANAFGVVEVEAFWDSADVCDNSQQLE